MRWSSTQDLRLLGIEGDFAAVEPPGIAHFPQFVVGASDSEQRGNSVAGDVHHDIIVGLTAVALERDVEVSKRVPHLEIADAA